MIIKLVVRQKVRAAYRTYPLMRPRYCFKITTLNMALFTLPILQFSQKKNDDSHQSMNLNEQQLQSVYIVLQITNFELYNEMNWIDFDTLII